MATSRKKLEFWDRLKQKFDWENKDLCVSDGKVEVEPVRNYPHIPAEIPGVRLESDLQPENGAVSWIPNALLEFLPVCEDNYSQVQLQPYHRTHPGLCFPSQHFVSDGPRTPICS